MRVGVFMEQPATIYSVGPHRVTIGYRDAVRAVTTRPFTAVEIIHCTCQLYIAGFCHLRLEMRTFRLDRIAYMIKAGSAAQVDPTVELLRWLLSSDEAV